MQGALREDAKHANAVDGFIGARLLWLTGREVADAAGDDGELMALLDGAGAKLEGGRGARFVGRREALMDQQDMHTADVIQAARRARQAISRRSFSAPRMTTEATSEGRTLLFDCRARACGFNLPVACCLTVCHSICSSRICHSHGSGPNNEMNRKAFACAVKANDNAGSR